MTKRSPTAPKAKKETAKCIVAGCTNKWMTRAGTHANARGYCPPHWVTAKENPKCTRPGCTETCADPWTDGLCPAHHPAHTELPPLASQVLAAMRDGTGDPVRAVQLVTGIESRPKAAEKLEKMSEHLGFSRAVTELMDTAGLTDAWLLDHLKENIEGKKVVVTRGGETVDAGKDIRASNSALDIALKLKNKYPAKEAKDKSNTINVQVNAILPPLKPPSPDQPVFRIAKVDT